MLTLHHIITDQWSMNIIKDELAFYYLKHQQSEVIEIESAGIDYIDYAYGQYKPKNYDKLISYWKDFLSGVPTLVLPYDFKRPSIQSFRGERSSQTFSKELSTEVIKTSRDLGVTPFIFFLSLFYIFLYNYSKREDLTIGIPMSNRNSKDLEKSIGLYLETLVLRTSIEGTLSIKDFILKVQETYLDTLSYKDLPFNEIVKALKLDRSLATNPLFQVMLIYSSESELPKFGEKLTLTKVSDYDINVSKFDLTLFVTEQNGSLSSTFEFATDLFEVSTIRRFQDYLTSLLEYFVTSSTKRIDSIPTLTKNEEELFLKQITSTLGQFASFTAIHQIIEDVAFKHPDYTAVSFNNESITYMELNTKANAVANIILGAVPSRNAVIGLCLDRSVDMIIGMLGILKAGCCYLPLDPDYPKDRTAFITKDAKTQIILTNSKYFDDFDALNFDGVINIENSLNAPQPDYSLPKIKEDDLAYIIYTSGSTGQPKGVPISHGNIISSTEGRLNFYDKNPKAFLLMSSISFDSSKAGIFWTLCTGGHLVITEKRIEQDIDKISALIKKENISHTLMLPSLYNIVLEYSDTEYLKSLTDVIVAGEACSVAICEAHFNKLPEVNLYNEYGPTEGTVWCIAHKITPKDLALTTLPIGRPVASTNVYILDKNFNHVPTGVPGILYISGPGLSKGYINRPEKTNEVFIDNPNDSGEIIYKTGDLAKYDNEGNIIFIGRNDEQIKIRGYRVELSEIENTINQLPEIKNTIVLHSNNKLSAYIKPVHSLNISAIKAHLKATLPPYMVPSNFLDVEAFPLLPNGKIDRSKLEELKPVIENDSNLSNQPKSDIEKRLVQLWQDILELPNIGVNDNFFEIGGDSILSIQITAKARKQGIKINSNQIFEHQSIAELAMFVSIKEEENTDNNEIFGEVPLFPIQKWFFDTHKNAPQFWNQGFILKNLPSSVNKEILKKITTDVVAYHPALRSAFINEDSQWKALILKTEHLDIFHHFDISQQAMSNYESITTSHLAQIQSGIQLENGGLFKCIFFDTGDIESSFLVLLAHHLVIDFVSWQIIFDYFEEVLFNNGAQIFHTTSIKDWGTHLLALNGSDIISNQIPYWKEQIPLDDTLHLDVPCDLPIMEQDTDAVVFELDETTSSHLMNGVHTAYNTKTDELLLVALALTISNWMNNNNVSFALERHGREVAGTNLDLSNTIGWLTSFFPKTLYVDNSLDLGENIIAIKENLRNMELGGLGYGILRYYSDALGDTAYPKIIFNYLGKQSSSKLDLQFLDQGTRDPKSERHYFLEINALIKDSKLVFNWIYANKAIKAKTIKQLIEDYAKQLKGIVDHCLNQNNIKYTPSDFEDIDLDQDDLDTLFDSLK